MLLKRPLDLVGTMPENSVVGERHPLTSEAEKVFTLELGSFYTNSVVIRDVGTGKDLVKDVDYYLLGYNEKASSECGGKQVDSIVVIVRSDVAVVAVDYQAVGGIYSNLSMAFIDLLRQVKDTDRSKIDWMEDLIDKPNTVTPLPHTHEIRDLTNLEDGVGAFTKLLASIYSLDSKDYRGIFDALYRKINNVIAELDSNLDFINSELDLVASKSAYMPGDVIVGDFTENPVKSFPEVDWVLLPETFLYGNTGNSATDPLTVDVKAGSGLIARTTHIYIAVPKGGAKYALARSKSAINEGESVTITLTADDASPGMSVPYAITGINTNDIEQPLIGSFILDNNLTASVTLTAVEDFVTEGTETLKLTLSNDPRVNVSVNINDTSKTPVIDVYYSSDQAGNARVTTLNEGATGYLQIRATNVQDGTVLNLFYNGTASPSDFSTALPPTAKLSGLKFTMPITAIVDESTEGNETLLIKVSSGSEESASVAAALTIVDTSKTQSWEVYYSRDTAGTDRIASINEGEEFNLIVIANNVANGTVIGINYGGTANRYDLDARYDNLTIFNGRASCKMTATEDFETEGTEVLTVSIILNGKSVASGSLNIIDTSGSANTLLKFSSNSTGSNVITTANEGDTFYLVLTALANLPEGTVLDIRYEGTAADADFTKARARTATILNKKAVVEYTAKADGLNEGDEVMRVRIINTTNNVEIGTEQITIKDTSRAPVYNIFYSATSTSDTPITSINEGETAHLTVTGLNIPNGKVLTCEQYVGGLLAITTNGDVDINPATTIVVNENRGSIPVQLKADMRTEGDELLLGIVKDGTTELGRKEITVKDTSITPTYKAWVSATENGVAFTGTVLSGQDLWLVVETAGVVAGTKLYLNYEGKPGNLVSTPADITHSGQVRNSIKLTTRVIFSDSWTVTVKVFSDASKANNVASTSFTVGSSKPTVYFSTNAAGSNNVSTFNEDDIAYVHYTFESVANGTAIATQVFIDGAIAKIANGHLWEEIDKNPKVLNGRAYSTIKLKGDQLRTGNMTMIAEISENVNHRAEVTIIDTSLPPITEIIITGTAFATETYNDTSYSVIKSVNAYDYFVSKMNRAPDPGEKLRFVLGKSVSIVGDTTLIPALKFDDRFNSVDSIVLDNNGIILGRGGHGTSFSSENTSYFGGPIIANDPGGPAISNTSNKIISIENSGIVAGGGGGGSSGRGATTQGGGGGGAPYGLRGVGYKSYSPATAGLFYEPGTPAHAGDGRYGGRGGYWGEAGLAGASHNRQGAAGAALDGKFNIISKPNSKVLGPVINNV